MSGETENNVSGWSVDTLHTMMMRMGEEKDLRYEQRFRAQQEALTAALAAAKEAVTAALISAERAVAKAEAASEIRFASVNEFRATLSDQAARLISRAEADARLSAMNDKVDVNNKLINKIELELREETARSVHRIDLDNLNVTINKIRDQLAASGGKSSALSNALTSGIAIIAVLVTVATFWRNSNSTPDPALAAISHELQLNREVARQSKVVPGAVVPP